MKNICQHCHRPTLGELVCTLTGNCYLCEHPDWWDEWPRNIVRDSGRPLRAALSQHMNATAAHKVSARLDGLLDVSFTSWEIWTATEASKIRYRNAAWGVHCIHPNGRVTQVYSLIELEECLQYPKWKRAAANEAGHIAVWPVYPFEGHSK